MVTSVSTGTVNFVTLNCRSMCNKIGPLHLLVESRGVDIALLTETWLTDEDDPHAAQFCLSGFNFCHIPRKKKKGGGVGILCRSMYFLRANNITSYTSFECMSIIVRVGAKLLYLFVIYRPYKTNDFYNEFEDFLFNDVLIHDNIIITGDLNSYFDVSYDNDALHLSSILSCHGLKQWVEQKTHCAGHTLDVLITFADNKLYSSLDVSDVGISDHFLLSFDMSYTHSPVLLSIPMIDSYAALFSPEFKKDLAELDLTTSSSAENHVDNLINKLSNIAKPYIRKVKIKPSSKEKNCRWYNDTIHKSKQNRRRHERKYLAGKITRFQYREVCQTFYRLVEDVKCNYLSNEIMNMQGDSKRLFSTGCRLIGLSRQDVSCQASIASADFLKFFSTKTALIRESLKPLNFNETIVTRNCTLSSFKIPTQTALSDICLKLSSTFCKDLDPLPPSCMKSNIDILIPHFYGLVKSVFEECYFPKLLKTGIVFPRVKDLKGDASLLSNYRPLTNISFLSKIVEKSIALQLMQYLETNNMLPAAQSAYRKNHSTETTLVSLMNDLLIHVDNGQTAVLLALDQSAAFDVLEIDVLLRRLECRFAIQDGALRLLRSYLSDRTVRVRVDRDISDSENVTCGVPQGSILGPLLYILYTAPLTELVESHGFKCHFYADDMQLYCVFTSIEQATIKLENCIGEIQAWMTNNFLKLNPEKTELIVIGKRNMIDDLPKLNIIAGGKCITDADNLKSLGVMFNSELKMDEFVSMKCRCIGLYLRKLSKVRKFLSFSATHTLLNAFVLSRLDYCNSLLVGVPNYLVDRLQRIQNWAIRLLFKLSRYEHVTFYLAEAHWLPVKERINFKILLLVYKCISGQGPSYLNELFSAYIPQRDLRSSDARLLVKPKPKTNTGRRAISFQGPLLWNELPDEVKQANSIESFKKKLKTFMFLKSYNQTFHV